MLSPSRYDAPNTYLIFTVQDTPEVATCLRPGCTRHAADGRKLCTKHLEMQRIRTRLSRLRKNKVRAPNQLRKLQSTYESLQGTAGVPVVNRGRVRARRVVA